VHHQAFASTAAEPLRFPEICDVRAHDDSMSVNADAWLSLSLILVTVVIGLLLLVLARAVYLHRLGLR